MPHASRLLRLVAFAVPAGLAMAAVQPLLGAAAGAVGTTWAVSLTAPAVGGAALVFAIGRLVDRDDLVQPPWYCAWLLLPGSFLLAGAAAMCIFGALVQFSEIMPTLWTLLASGTLFWATAIVVVRRTSH
ncbi:MAG: hypothetical protein QOI23_262 [Chloroflexota bacterium]|jgi:hypothetical protein|nr:hypothetical protein [Chloroflexota bacterium]